MTFVCLFSGIPMAMTDCTKQSTEASTKCCLYMFTLLAWSLGLAKLILRALAWTLATQMQCHHPLSSSMELGIGRA